MTTEVYEKQLAELSKFVNDDMKKIIESQREAIRAIEKIAHKEGNK